MLQSLIAFVGAAIIVAMVPGPSLVMIMRQAVRSGRRAGFATILGNETGIFLWGLAAAFGLSALLIASEVAYDMMRIIGAGVLIYFGVKALWQVRKGVPAAAEGTAGTPSGSLWRCYRLGVLTNLANPKAGVFAVSFLPQFVPDGAPVFATLVLFSVIWTLVDLAWYSAVVWLVARIKRVFERPAVRRRLEQISGVVLVALGIRIAAESR
jgi:threonine/homoserine/homoserine lactone efflux protein